MKQHVNRENKTAARSILVWVAPGMVALALFLLVAGTSGTPVGVLFFGGLLAASVSLIMPKSKLQKERKKKGSKTGLLALELGLAIIVAVAVAFSGWGHR